MSVISSTGRTNSLIFQQEHTLSLPAYSFAVNDDDDDDDGHWTRKRNQWPWWPTHTSVDKRASNDRWAVPNVRWQEWPLLMKGRLAIVIIRKQKHPVHLSTDLCKWRWKKKRKETKRKELRENSRQTRTVFVQHLCGLIVSSTDLMSAIVKTMGRNN